MDPARPVFACTKNGERFLGLSPFEITSVMFLHYLFLPWLLACVKLAATYFQQFLSNVAYIKMKSDIEL